jgi:hypothetical protein
MKKRFLAALEVAIRSFRGLRSPLPRIFLYTCSRTKAGYQYTYTRHPQPDFFLIFSCENAWS